MTTTRAAASRFLELDPGDVIQLPADDNAPPPCHVIDGDSIEAVNSALAIGRPLLVRGEPGTGKSQLARAVAAHRGWAFRAHAVDAGTETHDLLWRLDGVARLAEAQLLAGVPAADQEGARARLARRNFIEPGIVWWGFDWRGADEQQRRYLATPATTERVAEPAGCVLLIDEIDKADSAVPNSLLDALGHRHFEVPGVGPICMHRDRPLLVILTTNEERALPDAFVRRCLVLQLELPEERTKLIEFLLERGRAHFKNRCSEKVLEKAAELLADDRGDPRSWRARGVAPPGMAEYVDLVGIVVERRSKDTERLKLLERVAAFTLRKHPDEQSG